MPFPIPNTLVLAAGMSTRLAALTGGLPKPLTPVAGVPVLHRNLRWLASHGIQEVFINLHYRAEEIKASVGDGSAFGLRVNWSEEQPILGTAGAAKKLERELDADNGRFLVVYGDNLFNFNLTRMLAEHAAQAACPPKTGACATIAVFAPDKNVHTGIAGGRVLADKTGRITGFREGDPSAAGYVNAACYILEAGVLNFVPAPPHASDWMRDIFPALLQAGEFLRAYPIDGYCLGIDTPEAYQRAEQLLAQTSPPTPPRNGEGRPPFPLREGAGG